tara:strand:+ start:3094 stop:3732 length:639 start_codon:yes stop_codon:yes gene_type:complete
VAVRDDPHLIYVLDRLASQKHQITGYTGDILIKSPVTPEILSHLQRRALLAGGVIIVLVIPWMVIAPKYVTLLANFPSFLLPGDMAVETSGSVIIFRSSGSLGLGQFAEGLNGLVLLGGLVLLTPLVILTPGMSWSHRFDGFVAAFVITLSANVVLLTVFGWAFHWSVTATGPFTLDDLNPFNSLVHIALPTLLAGAWAWRFWLTYYLRQES